MRLIFIGPLTSLSGRPGHSSRGQLRSPSRQAAGARLQQYDWVVKVPIAAAFAWDGTRAAVGGTGGQIVVWDLDG
jgi:hypothetical protein